MLQIHLSNALIKVLKPHLNEAIQVDATALQWYGHYSTIGDCGCIVLMELQSRYAMVFCGQNPEDIEFFPDILQDRLWREVCVITQLESPLPEDEIAMLSDIALDLSSSQHFQKGSDPSVTAHIAQVFDQLRYMVEVEGYPLPEHGADAVSFGLQVNESYRKRKGDIDYFVPLEVFRDFWLGLIDVVKNKKPGRATSIKFDSDEQSKDNVIKVDFINRKVSS